MIGSSDCGSGLEVEAEVGTDLKSESERHR